MARKKLDPAIGEVLKKHGFGPEACWDCHGTWVVYHNVLEQIAAKAGIEFDPPTIIEADSAAKIVAICVTGRNKDGASQWSIGEAAPGNNKNTYPYAMAEKRAKDRVVLKLIGLQGLVYSEEEADEFKRPKGDEPAPEPEPQPDPDTSREVAKNMKFYIDNCKTLADLWGLVEGDWYRGERSKLTTVDFEDVRGYGRIAEAKLKAAEQPSIRIEADDNAGIYA